MSMSITHLAAGCTVAEASEQRNWQPETARGDPRRNGPPQFSNCCQISYRARNQSRSTEHPGIRYETEFPREPFAQV
jgi:hypothetical protein